MQRHPNQNADDIGAMLEEPSSFCVLISTTGVPMYRIEGWPMIWGMFISISV
jgi:hypothetical protein